MLEQRVSEVMSAPLVTIGPDALAADVFALGEAKGICHFPIVRDGHLVGFVCMCDLRHADLATPAMAVAWHHPAAVSPDCTVDIAARLMLLHGVGSLVVQNPSGPHGILTMGDLRRLGPELEQLLSAARCARCGAGHHLRHARGGKLLCADCDDRQHAADGAAGGRASAPSKAPTRPSSAKRGKAKSSAAARVR